MLCRTLLTAIAISYLICVLWLSGLQKEDLDVNMLRKLQRHNVNIDDMNSESLRKVCLNYKLKNKTGGHTVPVDEENRTTEATLFTENIDITRKILKAENDEMSQMLKDFVDNEETVSKETPAINRRNSKLTKLLPVENDITVQNSSQETTESTNLIKTTKSETIEVFYKKDKANLNRVIQFWQQFSTANTLDDIGIVTTSPKPKISLSTAFPNTKIEDTQNLKDFGYINSFFMNLINKHTKVSTTATTTTTTIPPMVDLNNLSHQIKTLMELLTQKNKDNLDEASPYKTIYNDFYIEKTLPQKKASVNLNKETHNKNNSPINIHDMLMFNDRLKKSSIILSETNQSNDLASFVNKEQKSKHPYKILMDVTTDLPVTISTTSFATKQTTMLSKDVINEIAENVKAIVLKDLQMSIASTTTLTPKRTVTSVSPTITTTTLAPLITTTTVAAITGQNTTSKPDETKHVLEKFMELFEQLKTMKDKNFRHEETIITKTTSIKTHANNSDAKFFPPPILQMSAPMLLMDAYQIKNPPEINPMILNSYPTLPVPNVQVYPNVPVLSSPHVVNPFLPSHEAMKVNVAPIIQTNLEEIPPLGIPMSKPSILIHQNIIVTTKQPHNSSQSSALNHRVKYLSDSDHSSSERKQKERFYKHHPSPSKYLSHHLYTTETSKAKDYFKFSSRLTYPRHISAASLDNNNERITYSPLSYHNSRYETFLNSNGNNHYHEKHNLKLPVIHQMNDYGNKKRERFHEKLERIVDWHEDGGRHIGKGQNYVKNKLNIISRQQKPLTEMKKPTKYDDTHFQNFLHSQQKVNEMLEKILTSKTITANEPVSVEIA